MNSINQPVNKRRRRLLRLLLILVPTLVFLCWLSLYVYERLFQNTASPKSGIDTHLPDAALKKDPIDKLAYYEQAAADSNKKAEAFERDRFEQTDSSPIEQQAYRQLRELDQVISRPNQQPQEFRPAPSAFSSDQKTEPFNETEQPKPRTEAGDKKPEPDPEIQQLDTLLDKIIQIQHPESSVPERVRKGTSAVPLAVSSSMVLPSMGDTSAPAAAFFSILNGSLLDTASKIIEAVVDEPQTVASGALVNLRLLTTVSAGTNILKSGTLLSGVAQLVNERMQVTVSGAYSQGALIPLSLTAYDLDGLPGINIPGSSGRETAQRYSGNALNGIMLPGTLGTTGTQLIGEGLAAGKAMLNKKTRTARVHLPAGYRVLLVNSTSHL